MIRTTERRADGRRVAGTGTRWPILAVLFNRQITLPRPGQPLIGKQFFMQVPLLGLLAPSFYIAQFTAELVDQSIVNQATPAGNFLWRIGCWAGIMAVFLALATMFARRVGYQMAGDARLWLYTRLMSTGEGDLDTAAAVRLAQGADPDLEIVERLPGTAPGLVALVALAAGATLYVFESSPPLGIALILGLLAALGCGILAGAGDGSEGLVLGGALEAVVLWLGGRLAAGAHVWFGRHPTDGTLVVALGAAMLAGPIAVHTRALVRDLDRAREVDDRLASVLAVGHPPPVGGHPLPAPSSGLELSGVRVDVAGVGLVDGVDVRVDPGELTILSAPAQPVLNALGATAAGLRPAGEGVVRLDGMAVEDANASELRRALRLVRGDPMLLAGSIRQNVTVGRGDEVSDDVVREALEAAGAGRLADHDGGLDADVGPNGALLSAAERQRVALARALVGRPRILILDDALSALNGDEEVATIESVRRTYGGLGVLVLTTRRPPNIAGAHQVSLPTTTTTPSAASDAGEAPTGSPLIRVEAPDDAGTSGRRLAGWGPAAVLVPLQVVPALVLARIVALVAPDRQEAMGRWALALGGMVALSGVGLALVGAWSRRRRTRPPGEAPPSGRPAGAPVPPMLAMTGAAALVVMLVISPLAVAAPLAVLLAGLVAAWAVRAAVGRAVRWSEHQRQRTASLLLDHLHARSAIQALGAERACTARYVSATWEWRRSRWWLSVLTTVPAALVQGAALSLPGVVLTLQYGNVLGAHEAASTALCLGSLAWLLAVCVVGAAVQPTWAGAGPPPVLGQSTQA